MDTPVFKNATIWKYTWSIHIIYFFQIATFLKHYIYKYKWKNQRGRIDSLLLWGSRLSARLTESSVWRALRRETHSNRESTRPLWFFHLYILSSATTALAALSTLCQGRLYPTFICIYIFYGVPLCFHCSIIVNVRARRHPLSDTIHTTTTISGVNWNEQMILIFFLKVSDFKRVVIILCIFCQCQCRYSLVPWAYSLVEYKFISFTAFILQQLFTMLPRHLLTHTFVNNSLLIIHWYIRQFLYRLHSIYSL